MICPHCNIDFHFDPKYQVLVAEDQDSWGIEKFQCTNCGGFIFNLIKGHLQHYGGGVISVVHLPSGVEDIKLRVQFYPKSTGRPAVSHDVPEVFKSDYIEACLVLSDSPKASAALSRRCLQNIIHNKLGIKKTNLYQEIQQVIDDNIFPAEIADGLEAVRNIGNFAAHPIKSESTGEIVEVEPAEADWNLEILEMLFEYLFVRPAAAQRRKEAFNQKLIEAGKRPLA